jgi:putative effector of murein hydrolase
MIKIEYSAHYLTGPLLNFVVKAETFAQAVILFEQQTELTEKWIWRMSKI